MITRDGYPIIAWTGVILLVLVIASVLYPLPALIVVAAVAGIVFIFHFFFFRDPEREIPEDERSILSPADGVVVHIGEEEESEYLKTRARKISIFLSVFNVHVNRMPVSGAIEYLDYRKGMYLAAFKEQASDLNEQSVIGVRSSYGAVLFKQIAGVIARRIVYHCRKGDTVSSGERFGMIRYGSRVDVFIPLDARLKVNLKDKVKGGLTVLGEFTQ